MPSPAFPFYPQDFIVGTADMTAAEAGGYIRLLCYQWCKGAIQDNPANLARLTGCTPEEVERIKTKFKAAKGLGYSGLLNERMEVERRKQLDYKEKQAANGKKGGRPTLKRSDSNTYENPLVSSGFSNRNPNESFSPSPSPSLIKELHKDARMILHSLNEKAGKHFRESVEMLTPISRRLSEPGVTTDGVTKMIDRCVKKWNGTEYADGLQPTTLFGEKFDSYYGNRNEPVINQNNGKGSAQNSGRNLGTYNEGTAPLYGDHQRRKQAKLQNAKRPDSNGNAPSDS